MTDDATPSSLAVRDAAPMSTGWRGIAVLAATVLVALALYGVGVLLPYYVNDLHRLPLAEVASGAHDPKELWPRNALGGLLQLAGFTSLAVLPLVAVASLGVGGLSLVSLWRHQEPQRIARSMALLVVMAVSVAALSFMSSTTGGALSAWRLD